MTTPTTWAGRALLVLYGFFGCSGAILFFNLFLERIITLLACLLKAIHERDLRRRGLLDRRDSQVTIAGDGRGCVTGHPFCHDVKTSRFAGYQRRRPRRMCDQTHVLP